MLNSMHYHKPMKKITPLILSVLIAQSAGLIGTIFTASSITTWYATLIKPEWTPPSWLFGPAWITLYTLMGIAAWMIWKQRKKPAARSALKVYGAQLVLNSIWSPLFFGLQNPGLAFFEIIILLITIVLTIIFFWRINKWAGIILLPYLAWSSFATFLNFTIWQLN